MASIINYFFDGLSVKNNYSEVSQGIIIKIAKAILSFFKWRSLLLRQCFSAESDSGNKSERRIFWLVLLDNLGIIAIAKSQ